MISCLVAGAGHATRSNPHNGVIHDIVGYVRCACVTIVFVVVSVGPVAAAVAGASVAAVAVSVVAVVVAVICSL